MFFFIGLMLWLITDKMVWFWVGLIAYLLLEDQLLYESPPGGFSD